MTFEPMAPDVGRRLCSARVHRGVSQGTVARRAGIAPSYLSRIETGKIHPTFQTVWKIMRALKADPAEIVGPELTAERWRGACPVTARGHCLLDLIRSEAEPARGEETYTPGEIRLLRSLAAWMKSVPPDRVRALEILLREMMREGPAH